MSRKLLFSIVVLSLCAGASAQLPEVSMEIKTFNDQPLPVKIISGTLTNFQFTSTLRVMLTQQPDTKIESTEFYLVVTRGNRVIAGEGWTEHSADTTINRQTKLALQPGDKAILVVDQVKTNTRTFRLDKIDVTKNILALIKDESFIPVPVQISMKSLNMPSILRVQSGTTYCSGIISAALNACKEQGGLHSVTCDDKNQSFSFTCNGNSPLQPPPGDH